MAPSNSRKLLLRAIFPAFCLSALACFQACGFPEYDYTDAILDGGGADQKSDVVDSGSDSLDAKKDVDSEVDSTVDTGSDTGSDTEVDTGSDTEADISIDVSPDTDASTDAADSDVSIDTSVDSNLDVSIDTDALIDTKIDTTVDTSVDTLADTVVDTVADTAKDVTPDVADTSVDTLVDTGADTIVDTAPECPSTVENCTNGIDDNCDGKIDCADTQCKATGFACVSNIPAGWDGYRTLFEGIPAEDPGCPADYPSDKSPAYLGRDGLSFSSAQCKCSCDAPQGQTCTMPTTVLVRDATCAQTHSCTSSLTLPAGWNGTCYGIDQTSGGNTCGPGSGSDCTLGTAACSQSVFAPAPTVTGGGCASHGPTETIAPVSFSIFARACGDPITTGKGCNAGLTCLVKPSDPAFVKGVCIFKSGNNACPAGSFSQKHLFYEDTTDTRGCEQSCTCGSPVGSTCSASITLFSDSFQNVCNQPAITFQAGTCTDVTGNPKLSTRRAVITPPSGGTCAASTSQPTGTVVQTTPTTFCCIP